MDKMVEDLGALIGKWSIQHGDYVLASGLRSHYYCDMKATTLSPQGALLVGEVLFRIFDDLGIEAVGGLAMGSVFMSSAVALVSAKKGRPIYSFFVRAKEKDHGLKHKVEQSYHPDGELLLRPGRRVAIVDDVVTKGGSILQAVQAVQALDCDIRSVLSLVDRQAGGGAMLQAKGLPYYSLFFTDETGRLHANEHRPSVAGVPAVRAVS